jgi:UDP-N-acetylglucosamine 2-epimerase
MYRNKGAVSGEVNRQLTSRIADIHFTLLLQQPKSIE